MALARSLAIEALAEAVARAVLAGGVVGAGNRHQIEDVLALGELVERNGDRRRGRAGHRDDLVVGDELLLLLHGVVGLGGGVGDDQRHLLAEHALVTLGAICLMHVVSLVDVLDGELHALELVFTLRRVGAGARHGRADGDGRAGRARRPCSDRRLVLRPGAAHEYIGPPPPRVSAPRPAVVASDPLRMARRENGLRVSHALFRPPDVS